MLQYVVALFWLSLLAQPASAQTKAGFCQLTGHIKGLGNQSVVFFYEWQGQQRHDTVRVRNDRFTYLAHPSDDGLLKLKVVPTQYTPIWYEPGQITITGELARPARLSVVGTPENAVSTQYNQQIAWKFAQRTALHPDSAAALALLSDQATAAFIAAHPQARTSAELLYEQVKFRHYQPLATYEQLLRHLAPAVQASPQGRSVARRVAALRNRPQVGRSLPPLSLPDTAGVPVSLEQFRGRYVLLDFWGHWCAPCIKSMPQVRKLQAQYAQQLAVVGIAMEAPADKALWLKAIRTHRLYWTQLSELNRDGGVIEQLNIEGFPTYLLLDKEGKLLVMNHELAAVEAELQRLTAGP